MLAMVAIITPMVCIHKPTESPKLPGVYRRTYAPLANSP